MCTSIFFYKFTVDSSKESSSSKTGGKLPIHLRLGTSKKGDDSPKKVKLKRNVTVGRKKQVLCVSIYILCLRRFMVQMHACGFKQPISCGKFQILCGSIVINQLLYFEFINYLQNVPSEIFQFLQVQFFTILSHFFVALHFISTKVQKSCLKAGSVDVFFWLVVLENWFLFLKIVT